MLTNKNIVKVILAILFFICLLEMPYGFYQFVRFAALVGFGYLAFNANGQGYKNEAFIYLALAILFQPLFKITLGRTLWNIVDVLVGIGLLLSLFSTKKEN